MRHLADQPAHCIAWQSCVGIERDDIPDIGGYRGRPPVPRQERSVLGPAQQAVQLMKLAALALPTDPSPFSYVPDAAPMKQQKAVTTQPGAVATVEFSDALCGGCQQILVAVHLFGRAIQPVGKKREVQITLRACEVMDLQPLD